MQRVFMPLLAAVALLTAGATRAGAGNRNNPEVSFNINEVVRRASCPAQQGNGPGSTLGSGDFMIDTGVVYSEAFGNQEYPSMAFDGTNYLVVWMDSRSGSTTDIYAARVSQAGALLDSLGIAVSTAPSYQGQPAVAFDGTNYLVVWCDGRNSTLTSIDIYGARVTTGGVVLDGGPTVGFAVSTAASAQYSPSVAFDGTNYMVAWMDNRNASTTGWDIYGARVTTAGAVLDGGPTGGIAVSIAAENQSAPSVVFDGTNCMVVWDDCRNSSTTDFDIYGARVTTAGVVLDGGPTVGIPISTAANSQGSPSVAFDRTNYLVVWTDYRSGSTYDIYATRVTTAGVVLDGGPTGGIAVSTAADNQRYPAVAFDGTNYIAVWDDTRNLSTTGGDIYAARVTTAGVVLDGGPTGGIAVSTAANFQEYPAVAFGSANYLVVWQLERSGDLSDICGARVTPGGTVLDGGPAGGIAISIDANDQYCPSVAFDGTNYLVVWTDTRNGAYDIYGARVSPTGALLDPGCFAVSTAEYDQVSPSVAFNGTNYLVVWQDFRTGGEDESDIYGARVTTAGIVLDGGPTGGIAVSTADDNQGHPSVAFNGTNYLVVWQDCRDGGEDDPDIYGTRVTTAGVVLDDGPTGGIEVSTAANAQAYPSVAYASGGTDYLVVWMDNRGGSASDIYGTRVTTAGVVLDGGPIVGIAVSTIVHDQWCPSVAFDGTNYLVVWHDFRSLSTNDIYGTRVTTAGVVLDVAGIAVSIAAGNKQYPRVASDGLGSTILWQNTRSGNADIYGARMNPSGVVVDSFPVVVGAYGQTVPAIARGQAGQQMFAVWQGFAEWCGSRRANAERIWGRFLAPGADAGVSRIMAPSGTIDSAQSVTPACSVFNYGSQLLPSYTVRMKVGGFYNQTAFVNNHAAGTGQYVTFPAFADWPQGTHAVTCTTELPIDLDRGNDCRHGSISVPLPSGWTPLADLPSGGKNKSIKDGGAMAYAPDPTDGSGRIYALKGNGRYEFYEYDIAGNAWITRDSIPARGASGKKKAVKKGGSLTAVGGKLYATKGNNSLEFWEYNPAAPGYHWTQRANIPTGTKNVKDAVGLVGLKLGDTVFVYLAKASGTQEFCRFNASVNTWYDLPTIPLGPSGKPPKSLVADLSPIPSPGDAAGSTIYALKGTYNELFAYNVDASAWSTKTSLPMIGSSGKKKKVKEGFDVASNGYMLYALKGGNTDEFWSYNCNSDMWTSMVDIPVTGKRVKNGGALTCAYGSDPTLYAFKGNNTLDFFRFTLGLYPASANRQGVQAAGSSRPTLSDLKVAPNPFAGATSISYSLSKPGNVSLKLYDITGKLISTLASGYHSAGSYSSQLTANGLQQKLAAGIYLLKFEADSYNTTEKLIIQ